MAAQRQSRLGRPPIRQDASGVYIPARVRSVFEARLGARAGSPDSRTQFVGLLTGDGADRAEMLPNEVKESPQHLPETPADRHSRML
jgi:hypothetical protein